MDGKSNDELKEGSTMKELGESTKGLYMIFAPFIPCLFWSLIIRNVWKKTLSLEEKKKED